MDTGGDSASDSGGDSSSDSDSSINSMDEIDGELDMAKRMCLSPDAKVRVTAERRVAELEDQRNAKLVARGIEGEMDMD